MDSIKDGISRILAGQFRIDTTDIADDTTLGELSFDSIVLIELALALDDAFGVEHCELHDRMTISDAAGLIAARLAAGEKCGLREEPTPEGNVMSTGRAALPARG